MSGRIPRKNSVSAREVHDLSAGVLGRSLGWSDHGPKCTVGNVLLVLFFAASRVTSLFDACRRLASAPSDQAVRNALGAWLPNDVAELERRLNLALADPLPKRLRREARAMAVDFTRVGYYGRCHRRNRELRRGKRKAGTSRFHCYATLAVIRRGERYTVAATYVWADDDTAAVVGRLLDRARAMGVRVRYLLLDREFYNLGVVRLLQRQRCPFLMPVVHRGKRPKAKRPADWANLKGTRRFLAYKRSSFSTHTMDNRTHTARVRIAVACLPARPKRKKKTPLVFAFWGFKPPSPAWVKDCYRRRYGIESSYRQMNQGRARTCGRDPRLRLLLLVLALVLRNVWVRLHHQVLSISRGCVLQVRLHLLRLRTMLLMLQRRAEDAFGCAEAITASLSGYPEALPHGGDG